MKFFLFFLIFFFSFFSSEAQQPTDPLSPNAVNIPYLEYLTKIGIDSVRKAHGLAPLRNDSLLYSAAKDHAHYLDSTNTLSHFEQQFPNKYTPQDRVNFHGGKDFAVGENILFDFALTPENDAHDKTGTPPHTNTTYGEMAHSMVMSWVHSPPHYKNMLTPDYEFTGLALCYDPKTKCFHAVQVFGTLPYYKIENDNAVLFPYEQNHYDTVISSFNQVSHEPHSEIHAWNLRAPYDSTKTCPYCWNENFSPASTKIEVVNGNIILTTKDVDIIKALIDNRHDGFAAEIVGYKTFDCGNPKYYTNPSRRNDQCIFSGRILKPVYRKKLKRGFKHKEHYNWRERFRNAKSAAENSQDKKAKHKAEFDAFEFPFDAESYSISLGKFPKNLPFQYYEINVVVIQKKQVCRVLHFTSFCGDDWNINAEFAEPVLVSPDTLAFEPKYKSASFVIPFEQGKSSYKQKDIQPFLDSLLFTHYKIVDAEISAYASVEGTVSINEKLQQERANSILTVMDSIEGNSFSSNVSANENWDLFDKQVKSVPAFSIFNGKSHDEIKLMLTDTALCHKLEPWLAKERYAKVKLKLEVYFYPKPSCEWVKERNKNWTDSLLKSKNRLFLDSLTRLQNFYVRCFQNGKIDTTCFTQLKYPADTIFDALVYNQLYLLREIYKTKNVASANNFFFSGCKSRVNMRLDSPYWPAVFGMVNEYMNYWHDDQLIDGTDPKTIFAWMNWLMQNSPDSIKKITDSLELEWYYRSVPYYELKGKKYKENVTESMTAIYNYWNDGRMNDSILLKLCNYFVFHDRVEWCSSILAPIANDTAPDHKLLMLYLQMTYNHIEEDPDFRIYAEKIKWAHTYLTHEEWCSLFVGPCKISFQLFDSEELRDLYCEECGDYKNYAKSPEKWKSSK